MLPLVAVLAVAVLVPGLGSFGLWEPQERQLADRQAPRLDLPAPAVSPAPLPAMACPKIAPKDALARSLVPRAMVLGRDYVDDSDAGRRLPFAVLGILAILATAGIAMRTIGARAGLLAALIALSMPLFVLQARQLTTEIGTATAGALVIYGLLALRSLEDVLFGAFVPRTLLQAAPAVRIIPASLEAIVGALALAAGLALGFVSGGALLGVAVPLGAFAAAGALGVPTVLDLGRALRNGALAIGRTVNPRWGVGRDPLPYRRGDNATALLATGLAAVAIVAIVYQIFSLETPHPGLIPAQREVMGHAIVAPGCWSPALGGVWRPDDELRYVFDSTFEQIAFGTFPWGILAPVAFAGLLASSDPKRRRIGAITLAWASASWIATELFQRKVGFAIYAGFPAFAVALGAWIDGAIESARPGAAPERSNRGARLLIALLVFVAALDLGKDLLSSISSDGRQTGTTALSALLTDTKDIYPDVARLLGLPTRFWVLVLGLAIALGVALSLVFAGSKRGWQRTVGRAAPIATCFLTLGLGAFWSFGWLPSLGTNLSTKPLFDTIEKLKKPGDQVILMGDLGDAAHDYAPDIKPEAATAREQIVAAIKRPNRVFAIAPATELCQLHREIGGSAYFVLDDRNVKSTLLSNKVDGTTDKNPLGKLIVHAEPKQITTRPKARIVLDNRIEILGWDIPKHVHTGERFDVRMYYKILQPVGGSWTVLFHFTGPTYFNGDHLPIDNKCPTSTWQPGDYIIDTHTVTAAGGGYAVGTYEVWTGFFTGSNPNFKNMPVSEAPGDMRDKDDRVKITTITVD
ncbi:MAG: glycosyltransferase family 39 protein [Deltaproteobacteria bacterium]